MRRRRVGFYFLLSHCSSTVVLQNTSLLAGIYANDLQYQRTNSCLYPVFLIRTVATNLIICNSSFTFMTWSSYSRTFRVHSGPMYVLCEFFAVQTLQINIVNCSRRIHGLSLMKKTKQPTKAVLIP